MVRSAQCCTVTPSGRAVYIEQNEVSERDILPPGWVSAQQHKKVTTISRKGHRTMNATLSEHRDSKQRESQLRGVTRRRGFEVGSWEHVSPLWTTSKQSQTPTFSS